MTGHALRQKFLDFFASKGHAIIPSSSIVPEHDPTVLFTTAGMHPLVPYLLGEPHPSGKRLTDAQKCLRTDDIAEVGDESHLTFFEMLGNWSLGDYFKKEAIEWSFEFLTSKQWLGIPIERLAVSCFAGDENAPKDEEAASIWLSLGVSKERIAFLGRKDNWWGPAGLTGPCGPDTEMFVWSDANASAPKRFDPKDTRWVEIWNDVFMQYNKVAAGEGVFRFEPLKQKNVDTGMGLERAAAVIEGVPEIFQSSLFRPLIQKIEDVTGKRYGESPETTRRMRIIADHVRAAVFVLGDEWGVSPSNKDQGYVVRRLIRRAIVQAWLLDVFVPFAKTIADVAVKEYGDAYNELVRNKKRIIDEITGEEEKFRKTLERGIAIVSDIAERGEKMVGGERAFELFATYGFPIELTTEIFYAKTAGLGTVDRDAFEKEFEKHQEISRAGSVQKFAGGLADHSAEVIRGHTATHLLHQALKIVLGTEVEQRGSNITAERLRFDFSWPAKLTSEQVKTVEEIVNEQIRKDLPVHFEILDVEEAKRVGALGYFEDKYASLGGKIKVYFVGDEKRGFFSKEICGGPHVEHTGELGSFKVTKEEAVSAGIRRIKAVTSTSLRDVA